MASEPKGKMYVPVWVDAGIVKAIISDAGTMPVTESTPLNSIQAQLYGDMADTWYKVRVSSGRSLHTYIAGQAGDIEITQLNPADLLVGSHGYNGSAWKKQGLIWSYYDTYFENAQVVSDVAGTFQINLSTVPTGEVWILKGFGLYRDTNANQTGQMQAYNGTIAMALETIDMPLAGIIYPAVNPPILKATQYAIGRFIGSTVGETCLAIAWGSKMKVDM